MIFLLMVRIRYGMYLSGFWLPCWFFLSLSGLSITGIPKRNGYVFSFFLMGIMIFLVCILLKTVEIQLGIALGLFAIFAITFVSGPGTYRSGNHDLFLHGNRVAVINAMATFYNPVRGMILINSMVILSVFILEIFFHKRTYTKATLIYDKLELLDEDREQELLSDITKRTTRKIKKWKS